GQQAEFERAGLGVVHVHLRQAAGVGADGDDRVDGADEDRRSRATTAGRAAGRAWIGGVAASPVVRGERLDGNLQGRRCGAAVAVVHLVGEGVAAGVAVVG